MKDYIEYRYVYHVPLSVLATGLTAAGRIEPDVRPGPRHDRAL